MSKWYYLFISWLLKYLWDLKITELYLNTTVTVIDHERHGITRICDLPGNEFS